MRERESLDRSVTGNYGEDSVGGDPYEVPILLAWALVDKKHSPLPPEVMDAVNRGLALSDDEFDNEAVVGILRNYFEGESNADDAEKIEAQKMFSVGWEAGVERMAVEEKVDANQDGWQVGTFSYLLGHLAGHFAYVLEFATPYEKESD